MDNTIEIDENWTAKKAELKKRIAFLIDHDPLIKDSKNEEIFLSLQIKLCKTKEELHKLISEVLSPFSNKKKI